MTKREQISMLNAATEGLYEDVDVLRTIVNDHDRQIEEIKQFADHNFEAVSSDIDSDREVSLANFDQIRNGFRLAQNAHVGLGKHIDDELESIRESIVSGFANLNHKVDSLDGFRSDASHRIAKLEEYPLGLDLNDYVTYDELNDREYARSEDVSVDLFGFRHQLSAFQSRLDTMDNNPEYSLEALSEEVSRLRGEIAGLYLRTDGGLTYQTVPSTIEVDGEEATFVPVTEEEQYPSDVTDDLTYRGKGQVTVPAEDIDEAD